MDKKFEIEATMDSGQTFTFMVGYAQVCRDGRARKYLEEIVAKKRAKDRKISGRVIKVVNLTLLKYRQSRIPNLWWNN